MTSNMPDIMSDAQLEELLEELAGHINRIETAESRQSPEYQATANRVLELEAKIRARAPEVDDATRERLQSEYTEEIGYIGDLL